MRWAPVLVTIAGCDVAFGVGHFGPQPDARLMCDPAKAMLNPEGCACTIVNATQACYLGEHQPTSRCSVGGAVTCQADNTWSACVNATAPVAESCFDLTDDDCDGVVDNGCTCADASSLCIDPMTHAPYVAAHMVFFPTMVHANAAFNVYAAATYDMAPASFQSDKGYCGGPASACVVPDGPCTGWFISSFSLTAKVGGTINDVFSMLGTHTGKIWAGDHNPPCDGAQPLPLAKFSNGSIVVQ